MSKNKSVDLIADIKRIIEQARGEMDDTWRVFVT